jgi:hypothetical protein
MNAKANHACKRTKKENTSGKSEPVLNSYVMTYSSINT